jgi:hypothetical protein
MPGWWNGIRECLKSICPKGHAGSNPAPGTRNWTSEIVISSDDKGSMYSDQTVAMVLSLSSSNVLNRKKATVMPSSSVFRVPRAGCTSVSSWSKHWPCLFPEHGPGRKHERRIALEAWQRGIAEAFPGQFARGLFHSDGCRFTNRARRPLADGDRWYEYPRYMFTNESSDIRELCGAALDQLGVPGGTPDATRFRWPAARQFSDWTSSSARSTENACQSAAGATQGCPLAAGWRGCDHDRNGRPFY